MDSFIQEYQQVSRRAALLYDALRLAVEHYIGEDHNRHRPVPERWTTLDLSLSADGQMVSVSGYWGSSGYADSAYSIPTAQLRLPTLLDGLILGPL